MRAVPRFRSGGRWPAVNSRLATLARSDQQHQAGGDGQRPERIGHGGARAAAAAAAARA